MAKAQAVFSIDVAMMGKLGYDVKVHELTTNELLFTQNAVKTYNGFKDIVWHGQQYRLQNPYNNDVASISYVSEQQDQAVIFNYYMATRNTTRQALPILLKGLDKSKNYKIEEINVFPGTKSPIDSTRIYSGDFLMTIGFNPEVNDRRTSVIVKITAA